jgi:hypothetical protein
MNGARVGVLTLVALLCAQPHTPAAQTRVVRGPLVHAHNCYPEEGKWADRIERALKLGLNQVAIEQDLAWVPASGGRAARSVVAHTDKPTGAEPTLDEHFFARVRPIMDKALADNQRERWPLMVLHLDFKTNETAHHQYVWELLKRHERWLTTAPKAPAGAPPAPLTAGPLLVLTENGTGQEADFSDAVAAGDRLLLFGTTPAPQLSREEDPERRARSIVSAQPAVLVPWKATNYRRWTNFAWNVIEEGGQPKAGQWTAADAARLKAIVKRAHDQGLWVRFYTLNGHSPESSQGWTAGYNFGSPAAVRARWQAAIEAGVDFIATDQYEGLAELLARR